VFRKCKVRLNKVHRSRLNIPSGFLYCKLCPWERLESNTSRIKYGCATWQYTHLPCGRVFPRFLENEYFARAALPYSDLELQTESPDSNCWDYSNERIEDAPTDNPRPLFIIRLLSFWSCIRLFDWFSVNALIAPIIPIFPACALRLIFVVRQVPSPINRKRILVGIRRSRSSMLYSA